MIIPTRVQHPAVRPPGALTCPLKSKGGQRGAHAKFGHILDFLVLKAVQHGGAHSDILARSGQIANIQRPCQTLIPTGASHVQRMIMMPGQRLQLAGLMCPPQDVLKG